jgi:alpha-mannosidase
MTIVHMIGNAHIDPIWLWPWQSGVDEVLATFCSAADRCEEYPDFIFTRGEAWTYQQVEQLDPEMFDRVRKLVDRGQWHITGGQWIQPDVNLPTWEALRQQIVHGRRYFQDRFGISPNVGYNVDSFGHPATLPDLLSDEGYLGYVFHRPNQQQTAVPAATFRWRGQRGEVLAFRIPAPYVTRSDDLYGQIMLSLDAADAELGHIMCFYGVGNHGGGPTKENIEYILGHRNDFPNARLEFSTPQRFFEAVAPKRDCLPIVDYELQRTFPGCYVVMHDIKCEQRHGEHLLGQTRRAIDHLAKPNTTSVFLDQLDSAWKDLLFTAFHDILAGTSIPKAWQSVRAMQGRARIAAEEIIVRLTRPWARQNLPPVNHQQIAMINLSSMPFQGVIEHEPFLDFDAWGQRWLSDQEGNAIEFQFVQPQSTIMLSPAIVFETSVPPRSGKAILVRDDPRLTSLPARGTDLKATSRSIANDFVEVTVSEHGLSHISYEGRDFLSGMGMTLHLREDQADTWGFQIDRFDGPVLSQLSDCQWSLEESGPIRARLRGEGRLEHSQVQFTVTLHRGEPVVHLSLDILFTSRFRLLQLVTHPAALSQKWRSGLAGGAVTRECSTIEWPVHGWAFPLTEPTSLCMLTQDAYSANITPDAITWSLLRSPRMAWGGEDWSPYSGRDVFTDQGLHHFEFQILLGSAVPWHDDFLHARAAAMAQPLVIFDRYEGMNRPPWKNNPPRRLWTAAEERARADGKMPHLTDDGRRGAEP